jgi:hypothetical protein
MTRLKKEDHSREDAMALLLFCIPRPKLSIVLCSKARGPSVPQRGTKREFVKRSGRSSDGIIGLWSEYSLQNANRA